MRPDTSYEVNLARSALIMSVYAGDRVAFLRRALHSILSQDHPSRILVGVDGPVGADLDACLSEVERAGELQVFRYSVRRGLAAVLNDLIDVALAEKSCEAVFRMDADDVCCYGRFVAQVAYLRRHQDVGVAGTSAWIIDEFDRRTGRLTKLSDSGVLMRRLAFDSPFVHPTVVFRADVLRRGVRYPTHTETFEDMALWASLPRMGVRFGNLDVPLLEFRQTVQTARKRKGGLKKLLGEARIRLDYIWATYPYLLDLATVVVAVVVVKALFPPRVLQALMKARESMLRRSLL